MEFEKESNNTSVFTVPARTIARILGKGGASIVRIKDDTGAQIDIERPTDDAQTATVTVKGSKKAIAAAKADILAIVDGMPEETTVTIVIENKYHRSLIGVGGQELRELIVKSGGPPDAKAQASLVHL